MRNWKIFCRTFAQFIRKNQFFCLYEIFFSPPARNIVPHALNVIHRMKGKFSRLCESDAKHKTSGEMRMESRLEIFVLVMRRSVSTLDRIYAALLFCPMLCCVSHAWKILCMIYSLMKTKKNLDVESIIGEKY